MKLAFKKTIYLLFLLMSIQLFGQGKPLVISLGDHCPVASTLRHHQIRMQAYPFDWVVTPFSSLYKVLNEDFENFFVKENLILTSLGSSDCIVDSYTGIAYLHDFPSKENTGRNLSDFNPELLYDGLIVHNFLDFYEQANNKYWKRVNRLRAVLNSFSSVVFIRHSATKEEAVSLRNLIEMKYPFSNFRLVIINSDKSLQEAWNEHKIQNYYLPIPCLGEPESAEWLHILYDSKLL